MDRIGIAQIQMKRGSAICKEMLGYNASMREQVRLLKAKVSSDSGPSRLTNVQIDRISLAEVSTDRNALGHHITKKAVNTGWDLELDVDLT